MKSNRSLHLPLALAVLAAASGSVQAATIANWNVIYAGTPLDETTVPVSGLTTNSPVFGSGANSMDDVAVAGRFGTVGTPESVTLAVGQTLTVTATITLTGGTTSSAGDYRFGVFNDGGQFVADSELNWAGGWLYALGTTAQAGLYQARTNGHYMSTSTNAVALTAPPTTSGTFNANSPTSYTWTMSITRDSLTTVDLSTSFVGGPSSYSQTRTRNDVTTSLFTYTSMGVYAGPNANLDVLTIGGAQYTIPEPSAALLGGLGFLMLLRRRRF